MIKHVIWDWNGTLLNDLDLCIAAINTVLAPREMPLVDVQHYKDIFGFPVKDYYEKLGFDFQKESFEVVGTEFIDQYNSMQEQAELQEGATQILQELDMQGIEQSILSAREEIHLQKEVQMRNIRPHFKRVSGLDNHYATSKLQNGVALIDASVYTAAETILIGDTLHDYEVGKTLGVQTVLFSGGHQSIERLQSAKGFMVDNLLDLKTVIQNIDGKR